MSYRDRFPAVANFFGTWFPDADIEGRTDEEVTKAFVASRNFSLIMVVRSELISLLQSAVIPWEEIGEDANRYFEDERDCRLWLSKVEQGLGP
jgi:hypothetical protein